LRRSILACGLLLVFAGMTTAAAAAVGSGTARATTGSTNQATTTTTTTTQTATTVRVTRPGGRAIAYWTRRIRRSRAGTQRWLAVMHGGPARSVARRLAARSPARLPRLARLWRHRERAAWWRANHPPELSGWNCIHEYEGSWTDSGGPYYGGLQMDLSFQATYGAWLLRHRGTADHWSRLEQIWAGVRAWRVRGFSPWPNTARYCGVY
jgi:hypothetical protein